MYRKKQNKWLTRELVVYGIAGVFTTAVNIGLYDIFCNRAGIENLLANAAAWAGAVLFAFVANDIFVFRTRHRENSCWQRFVKFIGARVASLAVDEAGMFLFVDCLAIPNLFSKVVWNVVVILMNYILSKKYIFR